MNKYALTEDQVMIQELAKKFADEVVAETLRHIDRKSAEHIIRYVSART